MSTSWAESLPFLVSATGARVAALFAERIAPLGVSPRQFGALANLARDEGQTQQKLADTLGIHRNNMVGLADGLQAAGWLYRTRHPDDRRAFALALTPAGRALVAEVDAAVADFERQLTQGWSATDRAQLSTLLGRIAGQLGLAPAVHPSMTADSIGAS